LQNEQASKYQQLEALWPIFLLQWQTRDVLFDEELIPLGLLLLLLSLADWFVASPK
jgi:hypothetical protein